LIKKTSWVSLKEESESHLVVLGFIESIEIWG